MANYDAQSTNNSTRSNSLYTDLNLNFAKNPATKDISKLKDVEAVKRSVRNLILTNRFERPFHPEIGADIRALLFENMTPMTSSVIARKIQDTIENFEPRARLVNVQAVPDAQENGYKVSVYFYIVNAPTELVQLDSFLERLR